MNTDKNTRPGLSMKYKHAPNPPPFNSYRHRFCFQEQACEPVNQKGLVGACGNSKINKSTIGLPVPAMAGDRAMMQCDGTTAVYSPQGIITGGRHYKRPIQVIEQHNTKKPTLPTLWFSNGPIK